MLLLTDHTESVGQSVKTILTPSIMIFGLQIKKAAKWIAAFFIFYSIIKYLEHYNVGLALAPLALSIALVSSVSRMCGGDMPGSNTLGSLSTRASGWSFVSAGFAA